jgi:DNA-binding NtrC family response regulator
VAPASSNRLVLLLEDDRRSADAMTLLIRDWGYDCLWGGSLAEVAPELRTRAGEVVAVITDFHLAAGETGTEAAAAAAGLGVLAPVLLLTGSLRGRARRAAAQAGYECLEKPAAPARLRAWLDRASRL